MIKFENVSKTFGTGESALSDVNLFINPGEFVFITGPSGSGKTTLFRLLTHELTPTKGLIHIGDWNINKLTRGKIPQLRRKIGVVFQDLKLLSDRTIHENIMLPLQIAGMEGKKAQEKVAEIMAKFGIESHKQKFPVQLSGGELQRVAIARAIVFSPDIVLADEPTGNLDNATSWEIVNILQEINNNGTTVLMATHNTEILKQMGRRTIALEKGSIMRDEAPTGAKKEEKSGEKKEKEPIILAHHTLKHAETEQEHDKKGKKEEDK